MKASRPFLVIVLATLILVFAYWRGGLHTSFPSGAYQGLADVRWNEVNRRDKWDKSWEWKMPIEFYGKVIDQDNLPIGGVEIVFQWTDTSFHGTSKKSVFSKPNGTFELTSVIGKRLGIIQIFKEGYYLVQKNTKTSFEYAAFYEPNYHEPDANNPVVFRLKRQGEVPKALVVRETLMGITPNGAPQFIDLETTRKSTLETGDISICIRRIAPKEQKEYDWSASINGTQDAGLIESEDEFMFEAPEDGYQPGYTYKFDQNSSDWRNSLRKKYYVRANHGQLFGRLEIEFIPKYQDTAAIHIQFYINPTGSRSLEYPPNAILPP